MRGHGKSIKLSIGNPGDLMKIINENLDSKVESVKNQVHITDGFFCRGCFRANEGKNSSSNINEDNSSFEEDPDLIGYDINPEMDEETKCVYCLRKRKDNPAVCLFEGNPSCFDCASKKHLKSETTKEEINLNISSINQLLNDSASALLNLSQSEVKGNGGFLKRTNTIANFKNGKNAIKKRHDSMAMQPITPSSIVPSLNTSINNSKFGQKNKFSIDFSSINKKEDTHSPVKVTSRLQKPSIGLNFNDSQEGDDSKLNKPYFTEYTHKEIDNKIMSLVSPRASIDLKYRKSINFNTQIEKLCKSLNVIFEKVNFQKININLPPVINSKKSDFKTGGHLSGLIKNLNSTGSYLFIFTDEEKEFLFGFLLYVFTINKVAKFFIKSPEANPPITYHDTIYEGIKIEKHSLTCENNFSFDFQTFKFITESGKLMKFFFNIEEKGYLYTNIVNMDIYDMC